MASMPEVEIFTDGACSGNPGPGGWGAVLRYREVEKELSGGETPTTNNRMELMAAIAGLEALKRPCRINLYTDSTYVRDGITKWLPSWKARGWKPPRHGTMSIGTGCAATPAIRKTSAPTRWHAARSPSCGSRNDRL